MPSRHSTERGSAGSTPTITTVDEDGPGATALGTVPTRHYGHRPTKIQTKKGGELPHPLAASVVQFAWRFAQQIAGSLKARKVEYIREYTHANRCKPSSAETHRTEQQPDHA